MLTSRFVAQWMFSFTSYIASLKKILGKLFGQSVAAVFGSVEKNALSKSF